MSWLWISSCLFILHCFGAACILLSLLLIIRGLSVGPGISLLRSSIIKLCQPLLFSTLVMGGLMIFAFLHPLSSWMKVIAPLSTSIWMIYVYFTSNQIKAGLFLNEMIPLVHSTSSSSLDTHFQSSSWDWVHHNPSLDFSGHSFLKTTFRALKDLETYTQTPPLQGLSIHESIELIQDAIADLHLSSCRFPLGQRLTLSQWAQEGTSFYQSFDRALFWFTIARSCINPFTLLDHKKVWGTIGEEGGHVLKRECVAWIHASVYQLISRHFYSHFAMNHKQDEVSQPNESPQESEIPSHQNPDTEHESKDKNLLNMSVKQPSLQKERLAFWSMLTLKFKLPFWIYCGVGAGAGLHLYGGYAVPAVMGGVLIYLWAQRNTFDLTRWQIELQNLAHHIPETPFFTESHQTEIEEQLQMWFIESKTHFKLENPLSQFREASHIAVDQVSTHYALQPSFHPTWDRLNFTLPNGILTLYWILDDFKIWYTQGGVLSKALGLFESFKLKKGQVGLEAYFFELLESLSHDSSQGSENVSHKQEDHSETFDQIILRWDQECNKWIQRANKVGEAVNLFSALKDRFIGGDSNREESLAKNPIHQKIDQVYASCLEWVHKEALIRLVHLYQCKVPFPPQESDKEQTTLVHKEVPKDHLNQG